MSDRCPYHDDLVIAVGSVLARVDEVRDDVKEIKDTLYRVGNGGSEGWRNQIKGQLKVIRTSLYLLALVVVGVTVRILSDFF